MAFDGSGNYTPVAAPDFPAVANTTIRASQYNNQINDIAAALSNCLTRDGQSTPSADQPMGGKKHLNVAAAVLRTQYARVAEVQDGTLTYLTTVAGVDTITATAPLALAAYVAGQAFRFLAAGANTGAVTLNINALGAKAVTKYGTTPLVAGDIPAGAAVTVLYDGTQFQLQTINAGLAIANHEAAADPHPGYLTPAEGNAAYQPLDADLTAIASLTTTAYGRSVLDRADAPALRSLAGLVIGTDVQAYDADIPTVPATQAEMEAGAEAALRSMSPLRVKQAILKLAAGYSIATLTGDVVNDDATANTLKDITGPDDSLAFAVEANATYEFEFVIYYAAAATTTGSRWALNGPTAPSMKVYGSQSESSAYATRSIFHNAYNAGSVSAGSALDLNVAILRGVMGFSAAGTLIARFASEVASSAITVKSTSYVLYRKR